MKTIENPILSGFNPDPSIVRVGEDYYIATSTFEWFPGVQIHHSKDLVHWRLLTHPLTRIDQLDMAGNPNSGGVWAPCLTHDGELFYLIYTDVKSLAGAWKDTHNYVVTAKNIEGPWSEPIYLNSSGFDPSMFHDEDGRKWLVNMVWDHRKGRNPFNGIILQEYSVAEGKLIGPIHSIFTGTGLGCTEGPHVYKRNGMYYLMTAEGGTGYEHAVTMARSDSLFGPYEVDPHNPILTSAGSPELPLQKAGHASLVETQNGEWYMVHLTGRPLPGTDRCNLGRETAIQRMEWTSDGWLRHDSGSHRPLLQVRAPQLPAAPWPKEPERDDFDTGSLSIHYSTLRVPADASWLSLTDRPGFLRLYGRESLGSMLRQSMVARRQQSFRCLFEAGIQFEPESFQQMAGITAYYNTKNHYYLHVTHDEQAGQCIQIASSSNGKYDEHLERPVSVAGAARIALRMTFEHANLQCAYALDDGPWKDLGPPLDAGILSDEAATVWADGYASDWGFTGTFLGLTVQDLTGRRKSADFDYCIYKQLDG